MVDRPLAYTQRSDGFQHMLHYYLAVFDLPLPSARYAGSGSNYILSGAAQDLTGAQYEILCFHLACDGVHQDDIDDVETIFNRNSAQACGLLYLLLNCASRLRSMGHRYRKSVGRLLDETFIAQQFVDANDR